MLSRSWIHFAKVLVHEGSVLDFVISISAVAIVVVVVAVICCISVLTVLDRPFSLGDRLHILLLHSLLVLILDLIHLRLLILIVLIILSLPSLGTLTLIRGGLPGSVSGLVVVVIR